MASRVKESEQATILLVDDEAGVVKILSRALKSCGYQIVETTDPREAAEILGREQVDVLISDIDMPGMSGLELVDHARRVRPQAVRILITGAGTMDVAVRAINEGEVHRFLRKPFDARELRGMVEEALARKAELRLASEAARRAELRRQLFSQLEAEHPGITVIPRTDGGAYSIDLRRVRDAASALGLEPLLP